MRPHQPAPQDGREYCSARWRPSEYLAHVPNTLDRLTHRIDVTGHVTFCIRAVQRAERIIPAAGALDEWSELGSYKLEADDQNFFASSVADMILGSIEQDPRSRFPAAVDCTGAAAAAACIILYKRIDILPVVC